MGISKSFSLLLATLGLVSPSVTFGSTEYRCSSMVVRSSNDEVEFKAFPKKYFLVDPTSGQSKFVVHEIDDALVQVETWIEVNRNEENSAVKKTAKMGFQIYKATDAIKNDIQEREKQGGIFGIDKKFKEDLVAENNNAAESVVFDEGDRKNIVLVKTVYPKLFPALAENESLQISVVCSNEDGAYKKRARKLKIMKSKLFESETIDQDLLLELLNEKWPETSESISKVEPWTGIPHYKRSKLWHLGENIVTKSEFERSRSAKLVAAAAGAPETMREDAIEVAVDYMVDGHFLIANDQQFGFICEVLSGKRGIGKLSPEDSIKYLHKSLKKGFLGAFYEDLSDPIDSDVE